MKCLNDSLNARGCLTPSQRWQHTAVPGTWELRPTQHLGPCVSGWWSPGASPSLTHHSTSPRACWRCWLRRQIQLLLPLRALQKIHKITHPLAPFLWTRRISTAGQHDPCIALPATIYFISPSLHPPVSPPSPLAWSTLCKEWVLQPHLVCPR